MKGEKLSRHVILACVVEGSLEPLRHAAQHTNKQRQPAAGGEITFILCQLQQVMLRIILDVLMQSNKPTSSGGLDQRSGGSIRYNEAQMFNM
jgi:hypothetical protein